MSEIKTKTKTKQKQKQKNLSLNINSAPKICVFIPTDNTNMEHEYSPQDIGVVIFFSREPQIYWEGHNFWKEKWGGDQHFVEQNVGLQKDDYG